MPKTLHTYYVGLRHVWPVKRSLAVQAAVATSARKAVKDAIHRLNNKISSSLMPMRYIVTRREDARGHSIHQVRLRLQGSDRDALIIVAALAAGVPEVTTKE